MRSILCALLSVTVVCKAFPQIPNLQDSKDWKMYYVTRNDQFVIPVDSLTSLKYILLNDDSMRNFVKDISIIPDERWPVWMGFYIVSYQLKSGVLKKIAVGEYGGYYFDEKERRYYQIPLELRREWLNYLSKKRMSLINLYGK